MSGTSRAVLVACLFICFAQVQCACNDTITPYPAAITQENGPVFMASNIFRINAPHIDVTYKVSSVRDPSLDFTQLFRRVHSREGLRIALWARIDFEGTRQYPVNEAGDFELKATFKCEIFSPKYKVEYTERKIIIQAVDEFAPQIPAGLTFNVSEEATMNFVVGNLIAHLTDRDRPPDFTNLSISLVRNSETEATYGTFDITSNGDITLRKKLDYMQARVIPLKVTITTANSKTSSGTVTINVLNVDNQSIRFVYSGCTRDCDNMHYVAHVPGPNYSGVLTHIDNGPIRAVDPDADLIRYTLIRDSWKNFDEFFTIGFETGNLSVVGKFTIPQAPRPYLIVRASSYTLLPPAKTTAKNSAYSVVFLVFKELKSEEEKEKEKESNKEENKQVE